MTTELPEEFIRNDEEIAFRKHRAELYRTLRKGNDQIYQERNNTKTDLLDDLMDGGDGTGSSRRSGGAGIGGGGGGGGGGVRNVSTLLKKVKSCYSRLSTLNASNVDQIVASIKDCNLARFIQETVNNLMKAKIKMEDVPAFVHVCSILHQQHSDFAESLQVQILENIKCSETTPPRRRTILCVYADLLIVHVYMAGTALIHILSKLIGDDLTSLEFENDSYLWRIISYCGADLVGVNRGPNTIMDPIFPPAEAVAKNLRSPISKYYSALTEEMKKKADEGMAAREESYQLFAKMGKFNTRPDEQAKKCKAEYDKLLVMAKHYGFIMKKEPEEFWTNNEEMIEITTPEGTVLIPKRIYIKMQPTDPINKPTQSTTDFYKNLVPVDSPLNQKLSLDTDGIHKELDRALNIARVDILSIYYMSIDNPTIRAQLISQISHISRNSTNQTPFYARFVANVSQKAPEIGSEVAKALESAFINFVNAQNKSQGSVAYTPKLHIARYISELAKFNVGIESYFTCLTFSLNHFYGRTIDMACTLILTAGKYLDEFCDATHIRISNAVEKMKQLHDNSIYQPHIVVLINQSIELFEPNDIEESPVPVPSINKYQAYMQHVLLLTSSKNYVKNTRKVIEKMWQSSETTQVTPSYIISQILELNNFSKPQFKLIAALVTDISKTYYDFGLTLVDILLERIRRGIERDSFSYRQRQLLEVCFLSELVNQGLIPIDYCFNTCNLILSLKMPNPTHYLITVKGRTSHDVQIKPSDFYKVKLVCEIIETLVFSLKKIIGPNSKNHGNNINNNYNEQVKILNDFSRIILHLQLFCLIRSPIPPQTAFDISDLLDKLEYNQIEGIHRYESLQDETLRTFASKMTFATNGPYAFILPQQPIQTSRTTSLKISSSDDGSSDDDTDDDNEAVFNKELNELKEEFRQEAKAMLKEKKSITIPIELMSAPSAKLDDTEKMTPLGPPGDFQIVVPKGEKTLTLSFKSESSKPE